MKKIIFFAFFAIFVLFSFAKPTQTNAIGEGSQYCGSTFCGTSSCDGPNTCTYHSWNCSGNTCSPRPPATYSHPYSPSCDSTRGSGYCSSKRPWACNSSAHTCSQSSSGTYSTQSACNTACAAPAVKYACNTSTYSCSQSATGSYTSLSSCETNCVAPAVKYSCNTSTHNCSVSATGNYTTSASCEAACVAPLPEPPPPPPPSCPGSPFSAFSPGVPTGGICMLKSIIGISLNILIIFAIILAILFLILGGMDWIMSGGDKQKLQSARQKITFAIIGLVVVFTSFLILNFINKFFGIS